MSEETAVAISAPVGGDAHVAVDAPSLVPAGDTDTGGEAMAGEEAAPGEETSNKESAFVGNYEEPDYEQFLDETGDSIEEPTSDDLNLDPPELSALPELDSIPGVEALKVEPTVESPESPAKVVEEVAATEEPAEPETPVETLSQEKVTENLEKMLGSLADHYKFSDSEAADIDEVDAKLSDILPKLAAKIHRDALLQSYGLVMQAMPNVVGSSIDQNAAAAKAEGDFFGRWPGLKDHSDVSLKAIQSYRTANPGADMNTVIEKAGAHAMIDLGFNPMDTGTQPIVEEVKPIAPPTPAHPGGSAGSPEMKRSYEENVYADIVSKDAIESRGG